MKNIINQQRAEIEKYFNPDNLQENSLEEAISPCKKYLIKTAVYIKNLEN